MCMLQTFVGKVGEVVGRLANFPFQVPNCTFNGPLGCAYTWSLLKCFRTKVNDLMNTGLYEMNLIIAMLVVKLFKLMFSCCKENSCLKNLVMSNFMLGKDLEASDKFAKIDPIALGKNIV